MVLRSLRSKEDPATRADPATSDALRAVPAARFSSI
jgi:hypothetical protein